MKRKTFQKVFVFHSKAGMSDFMINKWEEISEEATERKGYFVAALSGGKTPIDFYRALADYKDRLPWNKTHTFLVDERFLSFDDEDNNYRMLRETLFDRIPIPQENIHPIPTGGSTPRTSAEVYEEDLRIFFKLSSGQLPEFDLILLGMGEDGHTASLFPGSPVLSERGRLAVAVMLDEIRHHRITLTLPVINHARHVVFLVSGKNKAPVLEKVANHKDPSLPASMVNPKKGKLLFLSDLEAGSQLPRERKVVLND